MKRVYFINMYCRHYILTYASDLNVATSYLQFFLLLLLLLLLYIGRNGIKHKTSGRRHTRPFAMPQRLNWRQKQKRTHSDCFFSLFSWSSFFFLLFKIPLKSEEYEVEKKQIFMWIYVKWMFEHRTVPRTQKCVPHTCASQRIEWKMKER